MIHHWLHTIERDVLNNTNVLEGQIGHRLFSIPDKPYIEDYPIAFIFKNMPMNFHFRKAFDQLQDHFSIKFIDLGHLRNNDIQSITNLLKDLGQSHRIMFIGGDLEVSNEIINTFRSKTATQRHCLISDVVSANDAEQTSFLGLQRHLNNTSSLSMLDDTKALSLGQIKSNPEKVEPMIRNAQHVSLNLDSLDHTCLRNTAKNLTGLSIYNICQMFKYVGAAQTKTIHIQTNDMKAPDVAELCALLSWYFLEGAETAMQEDVHDKSNKSYVVYIDSLDTDITFIQGKKTGKWWLKNPGNNDSGEYIPCSYEDYETVCQNDIPNKFLAYFD